MMQVTKPHQISVSYLEIESNNTTPYGFMKVK
jgi:hypothetical protein